MSLSRLRCLSYWSDSRECNSFLSLERECETGTVGDFLFWSSIVWISKSNLDNIVLYCFLAPELGWMQMVHIKALWALQRTPRSGTDSLLIWKSSRRCWEIAIAVLGFYTILILHCQTGACGMIRPCNIVYREGGDTLKQSLFSNKKVYVRVGKVSGGECVIPRISILAPPDFVHPLCMK